MEDKSGHKRSKSARVMNLIRSNSHRHDSPDADNSPTDSASMADFSRLTPVSTNLTMTSSANGLDQTSSHQASEETRKQPGTGLSSTPSIEDSIRTFKVFEALRSKDAAAVNRAIQESSPSTSNPNPIPGTTILHLAIQCAEPPVVDQVIDNAGELDLKTQDRDGNTPLHLAAQLGRASIVNKLLEQTSVNDALVNRAGKTPLDLARTPEIFSQLQLARSLYVDNVVKSIHEAVVRKNYGKFEDMLKDPRTGAVLDVNALELATDQGTIATGGTLLHEAARNRDLQLAQILLMHGADPFRRDRQGKLPQDVTKDEKTRSILKRSPAAAVAQRGIQEKAILGSTPGQSQESGKESREMKGYLKKWTNYTSGYKLRWFVLEDGVMSYYKHQDDAGSACRGAINMRIAQLHMDASDKTKFEIIGKSSVKYHLKANHVVEAKRWFWALNNAIQHTKDEAKADDKRSPVGAGHHSDADSIHSRSTRPISTVGAPLAPSNASIRSATNVDSGLGPEPSAHGDELHGHEPVDADGDDEMEREYASSHEGHHQENKDAFNITAQSAKLQLELLSRVSGALKSKQTLAPDTSVSDPDVAAALTTYENAVSSLQSLVTDLLKIARDRDAYWQFRLERDADARKMWEESMAAIAYEHEDLKKTIAESEEKRKRTKRALKVALEGQSNASPELAAQARESESAPSPAVAFNISPEAKASADTRNAAFASQTSRRKSVIERFTNLSDSEGSDDEEFFDAVDADEVDAVLPQLKPSPSIPAPVENEKTTTSTSGPAAPATPAVADPRTTVQRQIEPSYAGYEDGVRSRLKLDADNRPKIGLWGILKSMIGKDMTKMTLPVSFNEPTSLLQRSAEDMEYADLLDVAADRESSLERLLYVTAFAASEYASTLGRVAKPFNPLLGETYEYVRPDKGYRYFAQQVSHHPPIGAIHAEGARWTYYGESAVKTKFAGKSFDAYPLGTWYCELRLPNGKTEIYSWKKLILTVVGIITGNPTVDSYGPMEVKNHTTGEVCALDFKARGWKASSAYIVTGKVMDRGGVTKWSVGGRWNDKIFARQTEGYEDDTVGESKGAGNKQAIVIWQVNPRPPGIPFNLTPFAVTFNDDNPKILKHVAPTDSRLRPDQRAMEDGEYDLAATEKNRVEEKQRATRRTREAAGEVYKSKYFSQRKHPVTGEMFWDFNGSYWQKRQATDWTEADDIF